MADNIVQKFEELVNQGQQLVPLGGFEFSGYNARLQNKYLEWRKACLESLEHSGPIGFPYKNKILGDANGGYFFQASAQLILNQVKDLYEKLKASPDLATQAPVAAPAQSVQTPATTTVGGGRVIKPPPRPASAQAAAAPHPPAAPQAPADDGKSNAVYVVGEESDPLRQQLSMFLDEIGLKEIQLNRMHGKMLPLDELEVQKDAKFAFFVFNADDLSYAMFELGHFVGKLGKGRVCVLHMSDVAFPAGVPGVSVKPIVVKLEEAGLGIMKELKANGVKVTI